MQSENVLYFLIWAGPFSIMMRVGCGSYSVGHGHHHARSPDDRVVTALLIGLVGDRAVDPSVA